MSKGAYTISISRGKPSKDHDERVFIPFNVDKRLTERNVKILRSEGTYRDLVNNFFHNAIIEKNQRDLEARHKSRMIENDDYYTALLEGKAGFGSRHKERNKDGKTVDVDSQEKPVYEYVIGIGNKDILGVTDNSFDYFAWRDLRRQGKFIEADKMVDEHLKRDSQPREDMKEVLIETAKELQERYPAFKFWTEEIHDDEPGGSCHLHFAFTPWTEGGKKGMSKRVSLTRALNSMGFYNDKNGKLAIEKWQDDVTSIIEQKMNEKGYEREIKDQQKEHEETSAFVSRNEALYWDAKTDELKAQCTNLNNEIALLQDKKEEAEKTTSSGATIEELDKRESELKRQADEQKATAKRQKEIQASMEMEEKANQKVVDEQKKETEAYKSRFGTLFAGIQNLVQKIPEPGRSMLNKLIQGIKALDKLDRFGVKKYEDELESSKSAYADAKKRMDVALADEQARTRKKRTRQAESVSKKVSLQKNKNDREPEY